MTEQTKDTNIEDVIIFIGIVLAFIMSGVFIGGLIHPEICGSGNCIESDRFYLFFLTPTIIGWVLVMVGMLFKLDSILKQWKKKEKTQ